MHTALRSTIIIILTIVFIPSGKIRAQFQGGNTHVGVYTNATVQNETELKWKFATNSAIRSTPVLSGKKIVIGSTNGRLYCLSSDGKELWRFVSDGSISSTPVIAGGAVYFTNRNSMIYALRLNDGKQIWKKNLGKPLNYDWGFDYYVGSPSAEGAYLYVGSADGHLYALTMKEGATVWKYNTLSMIRSTPAVDEENVYFGNNAGKVFAVNKMTGTPVWQFSTIGDTLKNEQFGFDRNAVIASPTLYKEKLFVGGRDGYLYALEKKSGRQIWNFDYAVSWEISTVAVKNDILVTGTSDGRFVHALDVNTGKELWRFMTQATVWASPAITGNDVVVIPSNDGYVYSLDLKTGKEFWRYKTGPQMFSSAFPSGSELFFGSDDGCLYALRTKESQKTPLTSFKRAVFWMKEPVFQSFRSGMDVAVRDYFIREGYEFYDETDVKSFLLQRINSDTASVLVFATNYFIPSITSDTLGSNILQAYLQSGGRIVSLGMNPASYELDSTKKFVVALNFEQAKNITGIPYRFKDLRTHGGFYASSITPEGERWGLKSPFVAICGMPVNDVTTVLALDENGKASAWVIRFSEKKYSGYVQLYLTPDRLHQLPEVQKAAEFGLH
ncbi:MAG: PQQ-binding-like beta-propeller repeat protein [Bacteroidota bacterium]